MANLLAAIGDSNLGSQINTGLNTAINLRKMENEAAMSRENMAMKREVLGMRREAQGQDMAIGRETLQAAQLKNQEAQKEVERKNTRFPFKGNAFIQGSVGIENEGKVIELARGMGLNIAEDGTTSAGEWEQTRKDLFAHPEIQRMTAENYDRKVKSATSDTEKAQKKFENAKEGDRSKAYEELQKAKSTQDSTQAQAMQASTMFAHVNNSKKIDATIAKLPEDIRKKYGTELQTYSDQGDMAGFQKAMQHIDTTEGRITEKSAAEANKAKLEAQKQAGRKEILGIKQRSIDNRKKAGKDMSPEAKQKRISQIAVEKAKLVKAAGDPELNPGVQDAMDTLNEEETNLRKDIGKPKKEASRVKEGVAYIRRNVKNKDDMIGYMKELKRKGWSLEDAKAAENDAGR